VIGRWGDRKTRKMGRHGDEGMRRQKNFGMQIGEFGLRNKNNELVRKGLHLHLAF